MQLAGLEIAGHVRLGVSERRHVGVLGWRDVEIQTSAREPPALPHCPDQSPSDGNQCLADSSPTRQARELRPRRLRSRGLAAPQEPRYTTAVVTTPAGRRRARPVEQVRHFCTAPGEPTQVPPTSIRLKNSPLTKPPPSLLPTPHPPARRGMSPTIDNPPHP